MEKIIDKINDIIINVYSGQCNHITEKQLTELKEMLKKQTNKITK